MITVKKILGLALLKLLICSPVLAVQHTAIELLQPAVQASAKLAKSNSLGAMPITVNTYQIHALQTGDTLNLSLPNMRQYALVYDRREVHDSQRASWIGHLKDFGDNYRVIITSDQQGSTGTIQTPEGEFTLRTAQDNTWLYDLNTLGARPFEPAKEDTLIPVKKNTLSAQQTSHHLLQNLPLQIVPSTLVTIDVMVEYTTNLVNALGSTNAVITKINQLITLTNQAYLDSEVGIQLRLVHTEQVDYNDAVEQGASLDAITNHTGVFSHIGTLRDAKGADLVVLLHPFSEVNSSCGMAWLNGYNGSAVAEYSESSYSVVATGSLTNGAYCGDHTFAHELGHNMGSAHDRRTLGGDTSTGAYPYSFGYGVDNGFVSIMGYRSSYTNAQTVYKFSNPNITTCLGVACGVSSQFSNSADNALSLNNTRQAVAAFRPTANLPNLGLTTPTLISPAGTITSKAPVFKWSSVANATDYVITISGGGGADRVLTVSATRLGCVTAPSVCTYKLATPFINATFTVKLQAINANETSPLSPAQNFTIASVTTIPSFTDVTGHVFNAYITAIAGVNITVGNPDGTFAPNDPVTRGQMAAFVIRALEGEPADCTTAPFTDVVATDSFCKYIQRMKDRNITQGTGGGLYKPTDTVTRDQMAAFVVRAIDGNSGSAPTCTSSSFSDVLASNTYCGYIKRLAALNVTQGCQSGTSNVSANYCPSDIVTRGQMAAFISRAFLGVN